MDILIAVLLVSFLFPTSSGGHGPGLGEVASVVACALLAIALMLAWGYAAVGLGTLFARLGLTHPAFALMLLLGQIAAPMLFAGAFNIIGARRGRTRSRS